MEIKYYNELNDDFEKLHQMINDEDYERFGDAVLVYVPLNTLDGIHDFFVVYENEEAIACGCLKHFESVKDTVELKRVFVTKPFRRKNIATEVVKCCEAKAKELGYKNMVLVAGVNMAEPMGLYAKLGYEKIDSYGAYENDDSCVCMHKELE